MNRSHRNEVLAILSTLCFLMFVFPVTDCKKDGQSPVDAQLSVGPTISAPSTSTGMFTVTLSYSWPESGSSQDGYTLEESTTSSTSGFAVIATSPSGAWHQSFSFPLTRTTGTYYYRARAWVNGTPSPYSSVATVVVTTTEVSGTYYASYDNLLMFNSDDAAIANTVYSSSELGVGTNYYYRMDEGYNEIRRASLLKFDVQSMIALKTILEAKLILYQKILPGDFAGEFQLAAIKSNWDPSTTTWNTRPNYYTSNSVSFAALPTTEIALQLDVTAIVQNWANGTWAVYGFQLWEPKPVAPGVESYQAVTFESLETTTNISRRPQLFLRYK